MRMKDTVSGQVSVNYITLEKCQETGSNIVNVITCKGEERCDFLGFARETLTLVLSSVMEALVMLVSSDTVIYPPPARWERESGFQLCERGEMAHRIPSV
jgi:hypothetical protein